MERIKICLVIPGRVTDTKLWSGTHNTLCQMLRECDEVEFTYLEYNYDENLLYRLLYKPIKKYIYTWNSPQDLFVRSIARRLLKKALDDYEGKPDIFLFPSVACCLPYDKRLKGKICVYTDCLMSDLNSFRPYRPFKYLLSAYYKYHAKRDIAASSILLTQNEWSGRRLQEFSGLSIEKIHNIRFGVNLNLLQEQKNYAKRKILIVLRKGAERTKGLPLLLQAFKKVKQRFEDAKLAVVGTDYGQGQEGVTCYYNQSREVTVRLFKESTLYVMPAKREPNGITYLEALANKTPIVGLNRFAFPEFCGKGKYGFISLSEDAEELADIICYAFSDMSRLKTMGEEGQKFVKETYAWEKIIESILEVVKENIQKEK